MAFILWMPMLLVSFLFFAYAVTNIYIVLYADDGDVLGCHYKMAEKGSTISDAFAEASGNRTEEYKRKRARDRYFSNRHQQFGILGCKVGWWYRACAHLPSTALMQPPSCHPASVEASPRTGKHW